MSTSRPDHDWDDAYGEVPPPWDIGRPQPVFVRLAEAGALRGSLLDAGCGTGEHTILAAAGGARALGVDLSTRAVEAARRKAVERGVDARFVVHDVLRVATLGEIFDTVVDCGLFHVFDDASRDRYVASLHGVLDPGGRLHLLCFSDHEPGDWGPRRVSEHELRDAFGSGWRIESLARDRFEINAQGWHLDSPTAEAWLAEVVRLPADDA